MFDRLVESSENKHGGRTGGYLFVTGLIYALALVTFVLLAVIGFNPVLADERFFLADVTLPPVPEDPEPVQTPQKKPAGSIPDRTYGSVTRMPILPKTDGSDDLVLKIIEVGRKANERGSSLVWSETSVSVPPPPPPTAPKFEPVPVTKTGPSKVSEGVLQGGAIKKVRPVYPEIPRKVRVGGPVQVQVLISEDGRVMEAFVINGHPLLRSAAIEAARQWIFAPTTLSKVPVKVQGVLTFNFLLE